jgi:cysteinyl-tRNA synthetase
MSNAFAVMHGFARASREGDTQAGEKLAGSAELLGLAWIMWDPEHEAGRFQYASDPAFSDQLDALIAARASARKAKDFAEADRIRAELDAMGVALKDAKDPATGELVTTWEVKR